MSIPQAYIFDVFGTLVDWRNSVAREAMQAFQDRAIDVDPHAFADYWRSRYQPAMERIRDGARGYVALDELHLENLQETLRHFDVADAFDRAACLALNTAWEKLDPWPDVVDGLLALKQRAIIAPCSNGSIALMTRLARYGRLPWDCILGADIAQNYKPEPKVYLGCCAALRLPPDQVMMVACHNNDLAAAQACGLQTAFIPRPTEHGLGQTIDLHAEGNWTRIVSTIKELTG